MLQDIPRKLLVQFPGYEAEDERDQSDDGWDGNQFRLGLSPDVQIPEHVVIVQKGDGLVDLINLESAVNEQGKVRNADPDDLDRILRDESVPDENNLV